MGVLLVLVAQRSLLALVVGGVALLVYCLLVFFWLGVGVPQPRVLAHAGVGCGALSREEVGMVSVEVVSS